MVLADSSGGSAALGFVFIIVGIVAYWLPTIIGGIRHVPNIGSVAVINGFLGWTVVGWVVAIAMAARSIPQAPQYIVPPGFQPPPQYMPPAPQPQPQGDKPYGYQ